jgi:hypothetical protein
LWNLSRRIERSGKKKKKKKKKTVTNTKINTGEVLRLLCLHLHHAECIDVHAASHGARCATCQRDIVPTSFDDTSALHAKLFAHLSRAPWAASLIRGTPHAGNANAAAAASSSALMATPPVTHVSSKQNPHLMSPLGGGVTSRKASALPLVSDGPEEDKYRRRGDGFQRLVTGSAGASATATGDQSDISGVHSLSSGGDKKTRTRLSASRALFLCLLLASGAFLVYIALTLNKDEALH